MRSFQSVSAVLVRQMFLADRFSTDKGYRTQAFGIGIRPDDHPIIVQFAANDPIHFVKVSQFYFFTAH